jgi:hypothetical protein
MTASFIQPESPPTLSTEQLGRLGELANKQVDLEQAVVTAEEHVKKIKKDLAVVAERDIPELMTEIGLQSVKTEDGHEISIKDIMNASISKDRKPKVIKWLMANDLESLISVDVIASFSKGDTTEANDLLSMLVDEGYQANSDEKINTSSVKAAVKELIEQGAEIPFALLGINIVKKSIVK